MNDDILVGRNELKIINSLMDNKRNIIVFGHEKRKGLTGIFLCAIIFVESNIDISKEPV